MRKQDTTAVINRNNREKSDVEMLYFKYQNYILLNIKNIFNVCKQIKEAMETQARQIQGNTNYDQTEFYKRFNQMVYGKINN